MASDLYIHILEGITEDELKIFFCNDMGSKYFDLDKIELKHKIFNYDINNKFSNSERVYVGSDSSIENGLIADIEKFIGEDFQIIDDKFIEGFKNVIKNNFLKGFYRINDNPDEILRFLEQYKGYQCFCVNW